MAFIASAEDYNEIVAVLQKYLDGTNGDVELLKEAFHKAAIINGYPIQGLYDAVERNDQTHSTSRIDYLDIVGNVASAKTTIENWHGNNFIEYQHLIKGTEGWKIIAKTYTAFKK